MGIGALITLPVRISFDILCGAVKNRDCVLPDGYYRWTQVRFMLTAMAVSVTVLASGSKGNCTLICSSGTRLLVDAGLSCRELLRRMVLRGECTSDIDAILITH